MTADAKSAGSPLRSAATIALVRDGDDGAEVCRVRRRSGSGFMPNAGSRERRGGTSGWRREMRKRGKRACYLGRRSAAQRYIIKVTKRPERSS